jgi:hypothetical protein
MIHIGIHTDNWRPLSVGFEAACRKIAATGLKHIEFAAIHGQNFITALGYDPGVSLQSNPRALRRFLDALGLQEREGCSVKRETWCVKTGCARVVSNRPREAG